ncbi:hypothetical protein LTSEALA_2365 [Salmonella enterica subsp. enterica serovar Alachua str. R6-377]|uniref:Uncharacterized protein n=1 Tax=Salmonella enterica subsp. enterica serovar Alachua str. R6-377 TaxID=913241 RepID=G5LNV9_SALET|nr:hypothetical protein LTSEALA_2365 [Salmonella enterica subsp. enterica serovar Alachua str. R6-377]
MKPCTPGGGRRNLPGIKQGADQMDKGQRFELARRAEVVMHLAGGDIGF